MVRRERRSLFITVPLCQRLDKAAQACMKTGSQLKKFAFHDVHTGLVTQYWSFHQFRLSAVIGCSGRPCFYTIRTEIKVFISYCATGKGGKRGCVLAWCEEEEEEEEGDWRGRLTG